MKEKTETTLVSAGVSILVLLYITGLYAVFNGLDSLTNLWPVWLGWITSVTAQTLYWILSEISQASE